jgi:hypothetical protein
MSGYAPVVRRTLAVTALFVGALAAYASTSTASRPGFDRLVCHDLHQTASTDPEFNQPSPTRRLVLGRVWLPKSSTPLGWPRQTYATGYDRFLKFGVTVTAGPPVTLSVPPSAQNLYALNFNNPAPTVAASKTRLLISPCPRSDGPATAWPGGYLVSRPACVPVTVTVDGRSTQVALSLGRRC